MTDSETDPIVPSLGPQPPLRKSPRARFNDYSGGDYFITVCTCEKLHYFGYIDDTGMNLSKIGRFCLQQLEGLHDHYPYATVMEHVVMPNHIHAIIRIDPTLMVHTDTLPTLRTALSVIIGGLKRAVTMFARRNNIEFDWQSRYHDHIVRDNIDAGRIAEYIENNIATWAGDCFNENKKK